MKRYAAYLMAAALILTLSVIAAAQYDTQNSQAAPASDATKTVVGTVVSVSASALVVRTEDGDQMIFTRDASSALPVTLSAGNSVRVDYETPQPGVFHVSNVLINAAGSDMKSDEDKPVTAATAPKAAAAPTSKTATARASKAAAGASATTANGSEPMPKTASPLPAIGLLGLLALGGGVTIHSLSRR